MIVLIYILSIVLFCIFTFILPIPFMMVVGLLKPKDKVILPENPLFYGAFIATTIILLYLTRFFWAKWGYDPGWLFPTIIAILHLIMGGRQGTNRANRAQAYGVVYGVIIYGILSLF
jgi:hypothetical protein